MPSKYNLSATAAFAATMIAGGAASAQTTPTAPNNSTQQRQFVQPAHSDPGHAQLNANHPAVATPVNAGTLLQQSGGSLLRASLSLPADGSRAKLRDVSFIGVAEPEPRTLKKHDLITVVI